jgi:serine/threonine protein kinase
VRATWDPVLGRILNGIYRVDSFIARGGMGHVYAGVNIETSDRVAIKIVAPNLASDPKILAKVRTEARLLTLVVHPAVVPYRVIARDPDLNTHYIVTDLVDGGVLSDRIGPGRASAAELIDLLRRLAGGLAAIHAVGAIHCDISPDNILLPGGRIDLARIVDLGIAKSLNPGKTTVIMEGFAGKIGYAAPEQLGVRNWSIGPWTDVYALALVVLTLASGVSVDMGGSFAEAIQRRRRVPPLDDVPPLLRGVLRDMLAPDPRDRMRSMSAVLLALDRVDAAGAAQSSTGAATYRSSWLEIGRRTLPSLLTVMLSGALATGSTQTFSSTLDASKVASSQHAGQRTLSHLSRFPLQTRHDRNAAKGPVPHSSSGVISARRDPHPAIVVVNLAPRSGGPVLSVHKGHKFGAAVAEADALPARSDAHSSIAVVDHATRARRSAPSVRREQKTFAVAALTDDVMYAPQRLICRRYVAPSWRTIGTMNAKDCIHRGFAKDDAGYLQVGSRVMMQRRHRLFAMINGAFWPLSALATRNLDPASTPSPTPARADPAAAFKSAKVVVCRRYDGGTWRTMGHLTTRRCAEQAFARPGTGFVQAGLVRLSRHADRIGISQAADWRPVARVRDQVALQSSVVLSEL